MLDNIHFKIYFHTFQNVFNLEIFCVKFPINLWPNENTDTAIQLVAHVKMSSKISDLLKFVRKQRIYNYFECESTLNSPIFPCIIFLYCYIIHCGTIFHHPKSCIWVLVNNICKQNITNLIL